MDKCIARRPTACLTRSRIPLMKAGLLCPVFFGHLNGFVDGDVGRNIRQTTQLIDRKAQNIPLDQSNTL